MLVSVLQINSTLGEFKNNSNKIIAFYKESLKDNPNLAVAPMYAISGSGAKNLLTHHSFVHAHIDAIKLIAEATNGISIPLVFSAVMVVDGATKNRLLVAKEGKVEVLEDQELIINNEKVSFITKTDQIKRIQNNLTIKLESSAFELNSQQDREKFAREYVAQSGKEFILVNSVGGQDALVYDGGSFVMGGEGEIRNRLPFHRECAVVVDTNKKESPKASLANENIYNTLVLGLRDFIEKNNFKGVVIGLSGGIDSTLSATIAVDALGSNRVLGVRLPSKFTSASSMDLGSELANNLGIKMETLPIEEANKTINSTLSNIFNGLEKDKTEENIQARIRGVLLMALSNKFGYLLLSTGNKSECSVGYATLYGDTCGGFNVIQDLYKFQVYELSRWRNENIPQLSVYGKKGVIPEASITRAPTAELRENQKDSDSLPEYAVLDKILPQFLDYKLSPTEVIKNGFAEDVVNKVWKLVMDSEYKRQQSCLGIAISAYGFSKNWHYPNTNHFTKYTLEEKL